MAPARRQRPSCALGPIPGLLLAAIIGARCPDVWAAQPDEQRDEQPGELDRTTLSGRVELIRLVDLAAERLGLNIEYHEAAEQTLARSVTLRLGAGVTDDELWALTSRLLASAGLTTVRMPGSETLSVVPVANAAALARVEAGAGEAEQVAPAGFESVVLRPEHLDAESLSEAVTPLLSAQGNLAPLGETGLLLLQDLRPRVEQALALLEQIDRPAPGARVEEITPRALAPGRLAAAVSQAVAARNAVTERDLTGSLTAMEGRQSLLLVAPAAEFDEWMSLIERLDRAEPVEQRSYRSTRLGLESVASLVRETLAESPGAEVVTNELTGTLLVTATPAGHEMITELIEELNAREGPAARVVRTLPVRNRSVTDVLALLRDLLGVDDEGQERSLDRSGAGAMGVDLQAPVDLAPALSDGLAPAETRAQRPPQGPGEREQTSRLGDIYLTADEGTSSIIAIGAPRLLEQVEALLGTLDVRQPQVVLDVTIVALTEGQSLDLGVELEKFEMYGNTMVRLASLFGLSTGGVGGRTVGDPLGFSGVVLSPGDFSVVIRALETVNEGRNVSLPRILVDNNQQATLDAVREEPFLSVNASDTIATTSFGGAASAGTQITLRPQIAEGDHLLLEYSISLSSFVGESSSPSLPPPRQDSSISSIATIPDGHAIVLGGLETHSEGDAESRVPLIGQIPLIGELFKNRSRSGSRTRFYVFIRASVMRGEGFEYLKHISARSMQELGMDDGWPEVEPRIIR